MAYERANIERLDPYVPGDQPQRADLVKLNTNENPYPPPTPMIDALRQVSGDMLRRYPPPEARAFRNMAAQVHGVDPAQVIATNGGDELLRLAVTVYCEPGAIRGGIGVAEPSYSLYPVLARIHDTPVTSVPLNEDWSLPGDFAQRVIDAGCRLVLVVNPHAPSGRLESVETLGRLAKALHGKAVLLIDEAYVDFAEHDALPLVAADRGVDNVILLRTLSKGYSLAGLRFGYGLSHPDRIAAMDKARDSYNTDAVSQAVALAALASREEAKQSWQSVRAQRQRVSDALAAMGCDVAPSQSNFILATPPGPPAAASIFDSLKRQGIFVRYFDQDRLRDRLRITIGTPQDNDALLNAMEELIH